MSKQYEIFGQNVFVRELKKEKVVNGFVMPETLETDFTYGEVVYCSLGYYDHGIYITAQVVPGDKVLFPKISGTKVTLNDEKLIRVYMSDIICKELEV